ncbi:hypothetical protein MJO29_010040 [Puccinia striiformis f. sp. tritici]|uniref:Uncharacterized protein n=2 Tax=Puccinia striiformis TaxID=27350 RepID=A0A0L0VU75_9BASI|nr:hypothetical protein Pst134EB_020015 [Puccinia striiformis f. sp. tritici]KAI7948375.1 hypothetical protein MJO29_010040 [Puccinia striiformis f. sp. tritici]KAI9615472.1 hypothetical protein H4Q26_011411 [Puccinia striiformis f. sp. tritici PST-130]KNF02530.1 hypothetical protein PSTG_04435 [Puccinia striiformis f. sp. tritici PST-78]POW13934.1 hypothetical protein PSTT_03370 [Puccinia striiformis]
MGSNSCSAIIPSFRFSNTKWQEAAAGLSIRYSSLYTASFLFPSCLPFITYPTTLAYPAHYDPGSRTFQQKTHSIASTMKTSAPGDVHKICRMIVFHNFASETETYRNILRKESKKDVFFDTKAKMIALHDLIETGFAPQTSIVHPRLWTLRAQGDDVPTNLGTPSFPKSDAKGQLRPR